MCYKIFVQNLAASHFGKQAYGVDGLNIHALYPLPKQDTEGLLDLAHGTDLDTKA